MKKNKYFIFAILLLLLLISCKENTSKLNKEITTSKQIEWESFVDDDIPHPTRFSFYDEAGNYIAGLFDENKEIIFLTRESDDLLPFHDGYCLSLKFPETGTMLDATVIDTSGKELFTYKTNGIYAIGYQKGYFGSSESGEFDSKGNHISGFDEFFRGLSLTLFDNDLLGYKKIDGSYLRNSSGQIIKEQYCDRFFNNGFAVIGDNYKNKYGLINLNGENIFPKVYSYLSKVNFGCVVASRKSDRLYETPDFGLLSLNGKWILNEKYYNVFPITENLVAVVSEPLKENRTSHTVYYTPGITIIDLNTNSEISIKENIPIAKYEIDFNCFHDGAAIFCKGTDNLKYGLINYKGEIILDAENDYIESIPDNGYWQVKKDGKWYLFKENEGLLDPLTYLKWS